MPSVSLIRRHFPPLYIFFCLLVQAVALAQQVPTFGLAIDVKSARRAKGLLVGDFNGDGLADVASYTSGQITIQLQEKDSLGFRTGGATISHPIVYATAGNFNGDKYADLVTLSDERPEVSVYLGKKDGSFVLQWTTSLSDKYEKVVVGDINNDKKSDLIFFSAKEPGLLVFAGTGRGSFGKAQRLFPDETFSAVKIEDLNDDRLSDIVGIDWISNEIHIYSGYGKLRFSNPIVIPCQKEPTFVETAKLDQNLSTDLIIGFAEEGELQTYLNDGFGNYRLNQSLALDSGPSGVVAADFRGNGSQDIAVLLPEDRAFEVFSNNGDGQFDDPVQFSCGKEPIEFATFLDRDSIAMNAAILDSTNSRIRILYTPREHTDSGKEQTYCLGLNPTGLCALDLEPGGWPDLVVANSGSQTFEYFRNARDGSFTGKAIFPVLANPTGVYGYAKNDSVAAVILSGRGEEKISVNEINLRSFARSSYDIPTQSNPLIIGLVGQQPGASFDIYALEYGQKAGRYAVTKFEQSPSKRFVEKNYTPSPDVITACVLDGKAGQRGSIVYLTYDKRKKLVLAFRTDANDDTKKAPSKFLFSVPSEEVPRISLWCGDINNDGIDDLIFNALDPEDQFWTSIGRRDSGFAVPQRHVSDAISVSHHDRLKIADMNGDHFSDLVLENDLDRSIEVYMSRGDGTFASKMRLLSSVGLSGFEICDVDKDSSPELVLVDNADGLLRIIHLNQ